MHLERVLSLINLLDVPEHKRKLWPQQSCLILDNQTHSVLDVIQFYSNVFTESEKYQRLYPGSTAFFVSVGDINTLEALQSKHGALRSNRMRKKGDRFIFRRK